MPPTSSGKFQAALQAYNDDNQAEALRLMEECAREDYPDACYMMACWLHEADTSDAVQRSAYWLRRLEQLAEEGNPQAQWEYSQQSRFGDLVPYDIGKANDWLMRAAEGGDPNAQHHLAWYLETGQFDFPVDEALASSWYEKAFRQDYPETIYLYAIRQFRDGQPTEASVNLLRKAADMGFQPAAEVLRQFTH